LKPGIGTAIFEMILVAHSQRIDAVHCRAAIVAILVAASSFRVIRALFLPVEIFKVLLKCLWPMAYCFFVELVCSLALMILVYSLHGPSGKNRCNTHLDRE
jgi:hypothetical protein